MSEHFRKKLLFEEHEEEIEDAQFMNYFNKQLKIIDKSISIIKIKQEEISNQKLMLEGQQNLTKIELEKLNKEQKGEDYIQFIKEFVINLKKEEEKIISKIEKCKNEINNNEIEIIKIFNKIKLNLDYLRKNPLNKESNESTLEKFIKEKIKNINTKEREYLENLMKMHHKLITIENIDIAKLTYEQYLKLKIHKEENKCSELVSKNS